MNDYCKIKRGGIRCYKKSLILFLFLAFVFSEVSFVFSDTIEDGADTAITITSGLVTCDRPNRRWIDASRDPSSLPTDPSSIIYIPSMDYTDSSGIVILGNCFHPYGQKIGGVLGDEQTCCSEGYQCTNNTLKPDTRIPKGVGGSNIWKCQAPLVTRIKCEDYDNIIDCIGDANSIAANYIDNIIGGIGGQPNDPLCGKLTLPYTVGAGQCQNYSKCECSWNIATGECYANRTEIPNCANVPVPPTLCSCIWKLTAWNDECENPDKGFIEAKWAQESEPGLDCNDACMGPTKDRNIPCGAVIKLEFFSFFNIVSVISILLIIYSYKFRYMEKNLKKLK